MERQMFGIGLLGLLEQLERQAVDAILVLRLLVGVLRVVAAQPTGVTHRGQGKGSLEEGFHLRDVDPVGGVEVEALKRAAHRVRSRVVVPLSRQHRFHRGQLLHQTEHQRIVWRHAHEVGQRAAIQAQGTTATEQDVCEGREGILVLARVEVDVRPRSVHRLHDKHTRRRRRQTRHHPEPHGALLHDFMFHQPVRHQTLDGHIGGRTQHVPGHARAHALVENARPLASYDLGYAVAKSLVREAPHRCLHPRFDELKRIGADRPDRTRARARREALPQRRLGAAAVAGVGVAAIVLAVAALRVHYRKDRLEEADAHAVLGALAQHGSRKATEETGGALGAHHG
eukprot:scaffold2388_cov271-Prasinococcus_capsulatus_cf.AAC.4